MAQEIGESREKWGQDVWAQAEEYANNLKHDREPFYIVFCAKPDKNQPNQFRQAFRFYRQPPPKVIGLLVWRVDHANGIFEFVPGLSIPPDVPIDTSLLSKDKADELPSVMEQGEKMQVLLA